MEINPKIKEIFEWAYCIIIAVVLALAVRYFVGTPTIVKQPYMYPTLKQDQRLILNRLGRTTKKTPERGEIVTFESPSDIFVSEYDADLTNPVAKYTNEPEGLFAKFVYYVLELNKTSYIKRVIGLPGDHVKIQDNKVYINGELLDEPYLQPGVVTTGLDGAYTDIVVPQGTLFLMGDNRSRSTDSRRFGCVPISKIESKVWIRFWPLDLFGKVE
jgi:signal peptidase I